MTIITIRLQGNTHLGINNIARRIKSKGFANVWTGGGDEAANWVVSIAGLPAAAVVNTKQLP